MLDASSLRRQVGKHAQVINALAANSPERPPLRERMGHTPLEIAAGIAVGIAVAAAVHGFARLARRAILGGLMPSAACSAAQQRTRRDSQPVGFVALDF